MAVAAALMLGLAACDGLIDQQDDKSVFPSTGTSPLPGIEGMNYKSLATYEGPGALSQKPTVNWKKIEPLLKKVQAQTGSRYVGFYSVSGSSGGVYYYATSALSFSPEALKQADGKTRRFFFEHRSRAEAPTQLLAAYIPAGEQAEQEMMEWILSTFTKKVKIQQQRSLPKQAGNIQNNEEITWCMITYYPPEGGAVTKIYPCVVVSDDPEVDDPIGGGDPVGGGPDDKSGPPAIPCDQQAIATSFCEDDGSCDPPYGCGGGGIGGGLTEADLFEERIIMDELAPCMKDEMNLLTMIHEGVGSIVQDFALDMVEPGALGNLNWEVKDGELDEHVNGETKTKYNSVTNTVTTIFDSGKARNATDLSIARLMLHEAVHAYVVSIQYNTSTVEERENLLGPNWFSAFVDPGHNYAVTDYRIDIADALEAFGDYMGYNLPRQFYEDMAWGGLFRTSYFRNSLSTAEKNRIKDVVLTELTGRDRNGNYQTQKGSDAGC